MLSIQRIRQILLTLCLIAPPGNAQEFVRKVGGYEVVVKALEDNAVLEISPAIANSIKVFTLPSPRRLVIDLPLKETVHNETVEVDPQGFLQRLRVGTHPDRLRIVVDVGSEALRYAHRLEGETSIFALRSADTRASETREPEAISERASNPVAPSPTTEQEGHRGVSLSGAELPGRQPAPPTPAPSPDGKSTHLDQVMVKLSKILFFPESGEVRLKLTSRSPFGLVRRGTREYVISLPHGGVASDSLRLDHFPPRELVGFTSVRGVEAEDSLHIEIGVDPNTRIIAVPDGNDIVLRVSR